MIHAYYYYIHSKVTRPLPSEGEGGAFQSENSPPALAHLLQDADICSGKSKVMVSMPTSRKTAPCSILMTEYPIHPYGQNSRATPVNGVGYMGTVFTVGLLSTPQPIPFISKAGDGHISRREDL